MEKPLSGLEQSVLDFYSDRRATRKECSQAIFGNSDPFSMSRLSSAETNLRKKGYLLYTVEGYVVNLENEDVPTSDRMKIQKRMGGLMLGFTKSNVQIIESTSDVETRMLQREQFRELKRLLDEARETTYGSRNATHKRIEARQRPTKEIQRSR